MFKNLSIAVIILISLSITSCATLFTGTKDTLSFNSTPSGAKVFIDGLEVCRTPCVTKVKRSLYNKLAEIKLDNYQTKVITLDRKFNVVSILNFAGFLGWGIDAATGSIMKYDRKGYDITLEKDNKTSLINNAKRIDVNTEDQTLKIYVSQK